MNKSLVLLSDRKEDQIFANSVAAVSDLNLVQVQTPQEAVKIMQDSPPKMVLVDGSSEALFNTFHETVSESLGLYSENVQPNHIHFLSDLPISKAGLLVHSPILGSFIKRDPEQPEESGAHYGRIVNAAIQGKPFGLNEIFEGTAKVQKIEMRNISQKSHILEAVKIYLTAGKWPTRQRSTVLTALDELLINAVYDAPQAAQGSQSQTSPTKIDISQFEPETNIAVTLAFDGTFFGVSVTDLYGSLDKAKLMRHIPKNHLKTEYKPKANTLSAGIGLSMVYQTGGGLVFICEPGVKTEALVYYRRTDSFKDFRNQFRFVSTHFYF